MLSFTVTCLLFWLFGTPSVFSIVITGPESAPVGGSITVTWTYDATDPIVLREFYIFWRNESVIDIPDDTPVATVAGIYSTLIPAGWVAGPYNLTFHSTNSSSAILAAAELPLVVVSSSSTTSTSPSSSSASSSLSSHSASFTSFASPLTSASTAGTPRGHSHVGAIASSAVAGTLALLLAVLAGCYVRHRRGSSVKDGPGVDLISEPPDYAVETSALLGQDSRFNSLELRSPIPISVLSVQMQPHQRARHLGAG
ncbi:hypothetical protein K438DRAFT_183571 [Mycena galopus ATCC 62051]|nr:hypothetical protein K438DRAFT_183571 [Mycena galopus ATCC 62051]